MAIFGRQSCSLACASAQDDLARPEHILVTRAPRGPLAWHCGYSTPTSGSRPLPSPSTSTGRPTAHRPGPTYLDVARSQPLGWRLRRPRRNALHLHRRFNRLCTESCSTSTARTTHFASNRACSELPFNLHAANGKMDNLATKWY